MNPRYPIMAALTAASLGIFSPGTSHAEPQQPPAAGCPPNLAGQTEPVNILSAVIACDTSGDGAKKDVGERLARFVLSTDGRGPLFVAKAIIDDAGRAGDIATDAKNWAKTAPAGRVAELYFVIGDAQPPAWVAAQRVLKQTVKAATENEGDWRRGFVQGLTPRWRSGDQGKIVWENHSRDVSLFLTDASAAATRKRMEPRSQAAIRTDVGANEDAPVVPVAPDAGNRVIGPGAQFTYEDMYLRGGAAGYVSGPKDSTRAPYNIKLETQKDPATGDLKTFVAVYDVSETPCYIRRFPITSYGENAFSHAAGRWNLVLDIKGGEGGDLNITLRRPDDKEGAEGIRTTASALGRARFDQAVEKGQQVDVGGQRYFVLAQGGGKDGTHLFYNASLATRADVNWREYRPELAAITSRVGPDGDFLPVSGKPDLGMVNGKPYRLEYDAQTRKWEVKEGQGDRPQPAASTTPGATPGSTADRVTQAAGADNWQPDEQAQAGLSDATKSAGYRILSRQGQTGKEYNIITPPNFLTSGSRSMAGVQNLRGVGHYISWERGGVVTYQDLLQKATVVNTSNERREDFDIVAHVQGLGTPAAKLASVQNSVDGQTRWLRDQEVLADGLKTFLSYSDADARTVLDRVRAKAGSGEYIISEAARGSVIIVLKSAPGTAQRVWPQEQAAPVTGNPQTPGTGTAIDLASSSGEGPFLESFEIGTPGGAPGSFTRLTRVKMSGGDAATASAALYKRDGAADQEQYYLLIKFRDAGAQLRRTGPILVFSKIASDSRLAPPDMGTLSLKGQTDYQGNIDPRTASASLTPGSTQARGVWALMKAPAAQVAPSNCAGPVMWWGGLTEQQAYDAACRDGRLQ